MEYEPLKKIYSHKTLLDDGPVSYIMEVLLLRVLLDKNIFDPWLRATVLQYETRDAQKIKNDGTSTSSTVVFINIMKCMMFFLNQ